MLAPLEEEIPARMADRRRKHALCGPRLRWPELSVVKISCRWLRRCRAKHKPQLDAICAARRLNRPGGQSVERLDCRLNRAQRIDRGDGLPATVGARVPGK